MTERFYGNDSKGKWADATISLGNYISVLASEYRLLKNNNQPFDTTLQELCFAIKTFNRLDQTAESYFRCPTCTTAPSVLPNEDLNGFFIRDDINEFLFFNHYPKLAEGVVSNKDINTIESDFTASNPVDKEMSHDQIWHLFIGFALVSELLNDNPMSDFPLNEVDGNTDIRQEAKNITDRIMNHIRNQDGPLFQRWVIMNPVTNIHVDRGWQVGELSYGAAEAACFIRNTNSIPDPGFPIHSCEEYHDLISFINAEVWNNYGKGIGTLIAISAEDNKVQNMAAVGHSWWTTVNPFLEPGTPLIPINVTAEELSFRAILRDYQHLMLVHQVLHGGPNAIEESTYLNLLNSAPCVGPYNFDYPSNSSSFEWSTENRLLYPQRRGEESDGTDKNDFKGEYNGLDYMLYHNLYYLIKGTPANYFNSMDVEITFPFPTGPANDIGTLSSPTTIEAFHTITASNIVNDNADVTYRAGLEVSMISGFEAHAGANFHAYVDPFECASDGEYRSASNNPNDSSLAPTENLVAYNGPTTYVYYPQTVENTTSNSVAQHDQNSIQSNPNSILSSGITISPNPNNGNFLIATFGKQHIIKSKVIVYNLMGNIIKQAEMTESLNIDISTEAKGIYFVKIENEKEIKMEKIVFQ